MSHLYRHPILLAVLWAVSLPATAQSDNLDDFYIDFAVPDLSAFTLLGVDGSQVSRPGNVRELSVALTNSLGTTGALEQGTGIEFAPFFLLDAPTSLSEYDGLLHRATLSLGAIRQADTTRFGLGFRWVLLDDADPYENEALGADIRAILRAALERGLPAAARQRFEARATEELAEVQPDEVRRVELLDLLDLTGAQPGIGTLTAEVVTVRLSDAVVGQGEPRPEGAALETLRALAGEYVRLARIKEGYDLNDQINQLITERKERFRAETWNARALQLAVGYTLRAEGSDVSSEGLRAFASGALRLGKRGQLIGHAQLDQQASSEDLRFSAGGRFLLGSATRRFSLEGLYSMNDERIADGKSTRFTLGGEIQLADGTYLELATGVNVPGGGETSFLTLGSIKYALRKDRRFPTP